MSYAAITRFQTLQSRSGEQLSLLTKLFAFQIVNIFFTVIVAGSILNALEECLEHPEQIIVYLGVSLPTVCPDLV